MEQSAETKKCDLCQKDIDVAKFRLHEAQCARNNFKCPKCAMVVAKCDRDQHDLEFHTEQSCQLCKKYTTMSKDELEKHMQTECEARPQQCQYCDKEIAGNEFEKHVQYCGSKTIQCADCGQGVQAWMKQSHKESGQCANNQLDQQKEQQENVSSFENHGFGRDGIVSHEPKPNLAEVSNNQSSNLNEPSLSQDVEMNDEEANEAIIAKLMQEDLDGNVASQISNQNQNQNNDDFNYDPNAYSQPEVRKADSTRQQQLLGGDDDDEYSSDMHSYQQFTSNYQPSQQPSSMMGGMMQGFMNMGSNMISGMMGGNPTNNNNNNNANANVNVNNQQQETEDEIMQRVLAESQAQFNQPQQQQEMPSQVQVQNSEENSNFNVEGEDAELQRAMLASMGVDKQGSAAQQQQPQIQQNYAQDQAETEDEILARILEESKNQQ